MKEKLNIVLVLQSGGRYSIKDVRLLAYHLNKWKGNLDVEIYCLYNEMKLALRLFDINFLPMEYFKWPGWWSKMNLFDPSFAISSLKPFLYLDLDTVILGDYSKIIPKKAQRNEFICLHDFYRPLNMASGMMWIPDTDELEYLWQNWIVNPESWMKIYRGDQDFIDATLNKKTFFQSYTSLIGSFKPQPKKKPLLTKPEDKSIICFHGKPSIYEAASNISWIYEYVKYSIDEDE
ncbi:MAG: hypothetical protein KKC20_24675 [Proteobacteria bacterium]|nr:hypothetical protein [Pseudomonadota bacterium]